VSDFKQTAERIVDDVERFVAEEANTAPALRGLVRARLVDDVVVIIREAAERSERKRRLGGAT
jgi:uncharacterized protein (DUF169 family)